VSLSIIFTFGIFCLLIISWQVFSLNNKVDPTKSYLLMERIKWIDGLNFVSRGIGFILSVSMLFLGFWQCVPGVFILGFVMSFVCITKQERRNELYKRIQREEREMANDFESTAWYNIEEHINKK
jgi:hypothetical protein